jgi:sucrose-6-phosphate hydrolase SacC (GH32 family)
VGSISHGFVCEEAAFFRSADGVNWTVTDHFSSGDQFISTMCPEYVVSTAEGLLAISQRRIWSSTDGVDWTEIDSPSWRALWTSDLPQLMDVASAPSGVVAIGTDRDSGGSIVAHSIDGATWQRLDLPADELPIVRDVASYPGGLVIVGRDGQADGDASPAHPAIVPGIGRAAAWTSSDGVSWTEATVQADRVQGGTLTQFLVGSDGLFGVGINTASDYYPSTDYETGAVVTAWLSTDATSWQITGALGADLPPMAMLESDGTNMVGLGLRQPEVGQDPTAWASVDGMHWTELAVSGPAPDVYYLVLEPQLPNHPPDSAIWVVSDGLIALGAGDGVPLNEPYANQWFRFGSTIVP